MTDQQKEIVTALYNCSMLPGSWNKRFVRTIVDKPELTDEQNEWIYRLLYTYRKQCSATYLKYKSNPFCSRIT